MFFYQFMDFVKKLASGELGVDDKNEVMQQKICIIVKILISCMTTRVFRLWFPKMAVSG